MELKREYIKEQAEKFILPLSVIQSLSILILAFMIIRDWYYCWESSALSQIPICLSSINAQSSNYIFSNLRGASIQKTQGFDQMQADPILRHLFEDDFIVKDGRLPVTFIKVPSCQLSWR